MRAECPSRNGAISMRIARRQVAGESAGGALDEVHSPGHARAAVHEQCERRANVFLMHEVQRLLHAVLEHGEPAGREVLDEAALLVLDRGFEQHAGDLGGSVTSNGSSTTVSLACIPERVDGFDGDLAPLERVLVDPLDRDRAACAHGAEQLPVDEKPHLPGRRRRLRTAPARRCAGPRLVPGSPHRAR